MKKALYGAITASTLAIIAITQASAQDAAEYSLAATGEQTHDSRRTTRQALYQNRTGAVSLPDARYSVAAPKSVDQSSYPSGTYDFGFSGGGGGNSRYGTLPVVSTSSVDINTVDRGRNSNQSSTEPPGSATTLPPATNPTGNPNNPFDLNTILANSGVKIPQLPSLPSSLPSLPRSPGWPTGLPTTLPSLPTSPSWPTGLPTTLPSLPTSPGWPTGLPTTLPSLPTSPGWPTGLPTGIPDLQKVLPTIPGLPTGFPTQMPAGVANVPRVMPNISGNSGF